MSKKVCGNCKSYDKENERMDEIMGEMFSDCLNPKGNYYHPMLFYTCPLWAEKGEGDAKP